MALCFGFTLSGVAVRLDIEGYHKSAIAVCAILGIIASVVANRIERK